MVLDMKMVGELRNKSLYKIFLIILKYIPIMIGMCYILNTILYVLGTDLLFLSILSGTSILTLMFFNYCKFCIQILFIS